MSQNLFEPIPVPAADGVGAAVDTDRMGLKTFNLGGDFEAEVALEGGINGVFAPLFRLDKPNQFRDEGAIVDQVRAVVTNFKSGAPIATVSGASALGKFLSLDVPSEGNTGAPLDVSDFGDLKSIITGGDFEGALSFETAGDVSGPFASVGFLDKPNNILNFTTISKFLRVRSTGSLTGNPTADIGSADVDFQDGGSTQFTYSDSIPAGGRVYEAPAGFEDMLKAANDVADQGGNVEIFVDVGTFGELTAPAPAVALTTYAVQRLKFHIPTLRGCLKFDNGVKLNGAPVLSAKSIGEWRFANDGLIAGAEFIIDTDDAGYSGIPSAQFIITNDGLHQINNDNSAPWFNQNGFSGFGAKRNIVPISRSGGISFAGNSHFQLGAGGTFTYQAQAGRCEFNPDIVVSENPGDGQITQILMGNVVRGSVWAPQSQAGFSGTYGFNRFGFYNPRHMPSPTAAGDIHRIDTTLEHGDHAKCDDLTVTDNLTYTLATQEITGADFSAYKAGDSVVIAGTVSNNGTFVAALDGTATELELTAGLVDEGPVASTVTLSPITLTFPNPLGHLGETITVVNRGLTNDVTIAVEVTTPVTTITMFAGPVAPGKVGTFRVADAGNNDLDNAPAVPVPVTDRPLTWDGWASA